MIKLNIKEFVIALVILFFSTLCLAQNDMKSNSDLLLEAVVESGKFMSGYKLLLKTSRDDMPSFHNYVKGLDKTEDIPFLLDVIKNGPGWPIVEPKRKSVLASHIARCYAVLCLASIKDSRTYPVLADLLENGTYLVDLNDIDDKTIQEYDIKQYAAAGLGILGDDRATDLLTGALGNPNPNVNLEIIFSLAKIGDIRSIKTVMNAVIKYNIGDYVLDSCLKKITKTKFDVSQEKDENNEYRVTSNDFPELGAIKIDEDPFIKIWQHWLNKGKDWTKQKYEEKYNKYTEVKQARPNENSVIESTRNKIANLGIAALPLIIKKIEKGETDLIPLVSQLTENKVKSDTTQKEVLDWWKANQDKWTIFK